MVSNMIHLIWLHLFEWKARGFFKNCASHYGWYNMVLKKHIDDWGQWKQEVQLLEDLEWQNALNQQDLEAKLIAVYITSQLQVNWEMVKHHIMRLA